MRILVSAESFGYGPITTCLNIVKELKKYDDVVLDFIGSGIALEQAKMSNYFDKYYICDTFDLNDLEIKKAVFKQYSIYLSSENVNGAIFALENGLNNTYYVDNLVWMWDKIPEKLNNVKKFFISETIPCKDNYERVGKNINNPVFVGPIRELDNNSCITENRLIVNIGGAESFLLEHNLIVEFYNKIINDILSSEKIKNFDSILVCGGSGVIDKIILENQNNNVRLRTLANEEYLQEMNKSSHCIMASGLGNFIETVGKNKNIMYIPAVNYSQMLQIEYYRKENFGFSILNWDDFDFYKKIPMYLDEATGVDMVVENIKRFMEKDYRNLINDAVNKFLDNDQEKYYYVRNEYINSFEKNSASKIAKIIYDENK